MVSPDSSIQGVVYYNFKGAVSGTEDGIIKGPDGEVPGSTHVALDRGKYGGSVLGKSLGEAL